MAVRKATRSNPQAQPRPQHGKAPRRGDDTPNKDSLNDPQLKSQVFATLAHLNRGYGIAVAALDRLRRHDRRLRPSAFPLACLNDFRCQTEALQAMANRDLLRLMANREELEAEKQKLTADLHG